MAERRLQGEAASPGLAVGPLVRLDGAREARDAAADSPAAERLDLERAMAVARRELEIERVGEAARQFLWLLKGDINLRMLCGPSGCTPDRSVGEHVAAVVRMFLRAYGPR